MAYVADLITVLNLLFGEVTQPSSSKAPKVTGQAPNDGYQTQALKVTSKALIAIHQTPKMSERRREIYYRITTKFPATAWNLSYMPQAEEFRTLLFRSLGVDPVLPPNSGNTGSLSSPVRIELMLCDVFRRDPTHQNLHQIPSVEAAYLLNSRCYLMSYDF